MADGRPSPVKDVFIIIEGNIYHGAYFTQNSTVYLRSPFGSKTTQIGGMPPEEVAKFMLSELVRAAPRD